MPRTRAAVVPRSAACGSSSSRSTEKGSKPSEAMYTVLVPLGAAAASMSMFTEAASTLPCWWSVWLPLISVRPGADQTPGSAAPYRL